MYLFANMNQNNNIQDFSQNNVVIEINHLKKSFNETKVLEDINMVLRKSENVVVLGKSGIGKSVLIKCIVGLIQPDSGSLKVLEKKLLR